MMTKRFCYLFITGLGYLCIGTSSSNAGSCQPIALEKEYDYSCKSGICKNQNYQRNLPDNKVVYCGTSVNSAVAAYSCAYNDMVFTDGKLHKCEKKTANNGFNTMTDFTLTTGKECDSINGFDNSFEICKNRVDCEKKYQNYWVYFKYADSYKVKVAEYCIISTDKRNCFNKGGQWKSNKCEINTEPPSNKSQGSATNANSEPKNTTSSQTQIAGTCNYKRGDGVSRGDYYLSNGQNVIPCNIPNDDKTCITGDIVLSVRAFMVCVENGWQPVDTVSLDQSCDENRFNGYEKISTDVATFYYKRVANSAKIENLHGCAKKQSTPQTETQQTATEQTCTIDGVDYTIGEQTKPRSNYYVCKVNADCDKIPSDKRLPNAKQLRCSGAKGTTCGSCIAETCNDNFTVKRVNGQNYGFCISKAEQGCIDAVGDKKWNNNTKKCDCGEKVWNATDNTCADATNAEVEPAPIVETPAEPVTCEESKGLKPSDTEPGKCVCKNEGWQIDDATGKCVEPVAEISTPGEPEMVSAYDELTAEKQREEEERQRAEEERKRAEQERKNAEQQRKDTEQTYKSAREKEQSWANKAVTAASTGATGLGLMQLASGYAEQKADKEAEEDMAEYITTMKCEYGGGHQVDLGNAEITLPGWEVLSENREKFKTLADQVKATKTALNLRPGIESEVLYERADTGLYEYENVGKTGGSNVSVARALRDSHSEDAAAWAEQKQEAKDQMKKGGITAAVGVGVGALGNVAINTEAGQKAMQKIGEFFTKDSE